MAFVVTLVDGSSNRYEVPARFRFDPSGALVIIANGEQTIFSPMTWARVQAPEP